MRLIGAITSIELISVFPNSHVSMITHCLRPQNPMFALYDSISLCGLQLPLAFANFSKDNGPRSRKQPHTKQLFANKTDISYSFKNFLCSACLQGQRTHEILIVRSNTTYFHLRQ